jgi:oligosaccharide repeat unit polymerase
MEAIVSKFLCIALSVMMLVTAYVASRVARSWLVPACIYSIAWFLFTFIPLVTVITVPANPLAIGYILLTCIAFSLPVLVTRWPAIANEPPSNEQGAALFDTTFLRLTFFFFAALALIALIINSMIQGLSLTSLVSNFFITSNALIADRYNDNLAASIFGQIANVACYIAVGLGGLTFPGFRTWLSRGVALIAAMLPSLIVMVVFGAKGMIFLCIAMFYAGTLVRRLRNKDNRLIDRRTVVRVIIAILILLPFITISFVARGLYEGNAKFSLGEGLMRYYVSYTCAHIYAFSDWFTAYIGQSASQIYVSEEVTKGFYTFMSIFEWLGSTREVPPGVYAEYFQYGNYLQTNIYTIFRGLITDFTLIGSLASCLFAGLICNTIFVAMARNRFSSWSVAFYIVMAGFIYTSFIISLLIWNSSYPTFIVIALVLIINNARFRAGRAKSAPTQYPEGFRA